MNPNIEYTRGVGQPFLNASDYIFYIELHIEKERNDYYYDEELSSVRQLNPEIPRLPEILNKLVNDLQTAFDFFITEFLENDGIYCLLNLLRLCLNRQQFPGTNRISEALVSGSNMRNNKQNKDRHHYLKRALSDEYDCLLSMQLAVKRNSRALQKLISHKTGLSTLTACIVSNLTKSRLIALQLLTRVCDLPEGATKVLEAMSTMRIIFGESVRFKFLVSMINSANSWSSNSIECNALSLLNTLLVKTCSCAERIRLQCELEEAGLDLEIIEKSVNEKNVPKDERIWTELKRFRKQYIDVNDKLNPKSYCFEEKDELKEEVQILQRALFKLEEDKINLMSIERQLKEKCEDLEQEVDHLKSKFNVLIPNKKTLTTPISDNGTADSGQWTDSEPDFSGKLKVKNERIERKDTQKDYIYDQNMKNEEEFIYVPSIHPPPDYGHYIQKERHSTDSGDLINANFTKSYIRNSNEIDRREDINQLSRKQNNWSKFRDSNDSIKEQMNDEGPFVVNVHPKQVFDETIAKYNESSVGKDRGHSELLLDWNYSAMSHQDRKWPIKSRESDRLIIPGPYRQKSMSLNRINNARDGYDCHSDKQIDKKNSSSTDGQKCSADSDFKLFAKRSKDNLSQSNDCLQFKGSKKKNTLRTSLQSYFFSGCSTLKLNKKVFHSIDSVDESPKSFPLPKTYKKNFILKGHGNCGLFSGDNKKQGNDKNLSDDLKSVPQLDPLSPLDSLVHQEITEATKQLCDWP